MRFLRYWITTALLLLAPTLLVNAQHSMLGVPQDVTTRLINETFDGIETQYYLHESKILDFKWDGVGQFWIPDDEANYAASLSYKDRRLPNLKMQLSVHRPNSQITTLDDPTLERFRASLEKSLLAGGNTWDFLNPEATRPPVGSRPFFGGYYRMLEYLVTPIDKTLEPYRIIEYYRILESDIIIVLRYAGPSDVIERMKDSLPREMSRFSVL